MAETVSDTVRLTKAQRELLREMGDDPVGMIGAASHYVPAKLLVSKGMAVWRDGDPYSERLIITPAGLAALESNSHE